MKDKMIEKDPYAQKKEHKGTKLRRKLFVKGSLKQLILSNELLRKKT